MQVQFRSLPYKLNPKSAGPRAALGSLLPTERLQLEIGLRTRWVGSAVFFGRKGGGNVLIDLFPTGRSGKADTETDGGRRRTERTSTDYDIGHG